MKRFLFILAALFCMQNTIAQEFTQNELIEWMGYNKSEKDSINVVSVNNDWHNFRNAKMELLKGESLKKPSFVVSSNLQYLLYFDDKDLPVLGKVTNTKRQEEDELVQVEVVYQFPTVKAGWLQASETILYIQASDGNVQYVNPNKQYWGLTNGRDTNKVLLYKVNKLKVTNDGRIVLLDKNDSEIWSHH
ncbi:hypothetical protein [Polaribacter sp.]|uniref:hypothetical protein n=1 Tax=Polaribacter sp. TaxID=1920175 RepID=UPI003EF24610